MRRNGILVQKRTNDLLLFAAPISPDGPRDALALLELRDDQSRRRAEACSRCRGSDDLRCAQITLDARVAAAGQDVAARRDDFRCQRMRCAPRTRNTRPARSAASLAAPGQMLCVHRHGTTGRLIEAEQFGDIIVRAGGPAGVLASRTSPRVELGAAELRGDVDSERRQPMVGLGMFLQTGANALDVAGCGRSEARTR